MKTKNKYFTGKSLFQKTGLILTIFMFTLSGSAQEWLQVGEDIDGIQSGDYLGYFVAMSSNGYTIAAGAKGNDANGEDAGAARIYTWNGSSWVQKGNDIKGSEAEDELGYSIALSDDGNIVAVGATQDDDSELRAGYAQVFTWNGSAWEQMGVNFTGDNAYDRFGTAINLSSDGHIVAISARNGINGVESGSIKVYEWDGSTWAKKGNKINGDAIGDSFGWSLCLSSDGNSLAVGIPMDGVNFSGYARMYIWNGSDWEQKGSDIAGEANGDRFGWAISTNNDGNTLAISARDYDGSGMERGQVKVFSWSGSNWDQKGNEVTGLADNEYLGWSVCLSADGNIFAAGVPASLGTGFDEGHLRVFEWDGAIWEQKGLDIDGESEGDRSGWSSAMNAEGNMVAISAPFNAGISWGVGQVRVYAFGFVDITEQEFGSAFRVYPNPVIDYVNVDLGHTHQNVTLTIRNIAGQLISTTSYDIIDVIRYKLEEPNGIYILEIKSGDGKSAVLMVMKGL